MKNNSNTIDVLKLFFSFCVVGIHTGLLEEFSDVTNWYITHMVFRLAVPFFFCVSGYFLGCKVNSNVDSYKSILKKYRKNMLWLLLFWGTIGIGFYIIKLKRDSISSVGIIVRVIKTAFFYPRNSMWFVAACFVGAGVLQIIIRCNINKKLVTVVAIFLYCFALLSNTYYFFIIGKPIQSLIDVYLEICISPRNGIFMFLFIWLGYLLYCSNIQKVVRAYKWCIGGGLCICIGLLGVEAFICYGKETADDNSLFFIFIVLIPSLVLWALEHNVEWKLPYNSCRTLSRTIYYTHPVVNQVVRGFLKISNGFFRFGLTCIVCVGLWCLFRKSSNKFVRKTFGC